MSIILNNVIANKYLILEQIGKGSFGTIYKGKNIRKNTVVAIKTEPIKNNTNLLLNESRIYNYLSQINIPGIPTVKWFGKDKHYYYMVIKLLGSSLQDLKNKLNIVPFKLILQITMQILNILKEIHNSGLVHRDVKPENFLLDLDNKQIYIIDFGFCIVYNSNNNTNNTNLIGSLNYASINAHNNKKLYPKDDLESLGYILIYLYSGTLPWINLTNNNEIKYQKENICFDNIPIVLSGFIKYIKSLQYDDEYPNYDILFNIINVI